MADEDVAVSVTKRRFHPFINSTWRSLSSLFIFYGMVATRGPVIYTRGMVDDTNKSESPVMYDVFFHCDIRYLSPVPKALFPVHTYSPREV